MNKFKGTKGQWSFEAGDRNKLTVVKIGNAHEIELEINHEKRICEEIANGQLIAAAPDLLEALLNIENDNGSIPLPIWEMRNKAINKALGDEQ